MHEAKRALRRRMRAVRRDLGDVRDRSAAIVDHLAQIPALRAASVVMLFDAVPGEPDLSALAGDLAGRGVRVVRPDPSPAAVVPVDPRIVDVVVVPGLAFTRDAQRLGQGGGWYDRFLAGLREDASAVGVCFSDQLVDDLPTEGHDVTLDVVVTEHGIVGSPDAER